MRCTSDDYFLGVSLKSASNLIYFANTAAKCIDTDKTTELFLSSTNTCIYAACKAFLSSCGAGRTHLHVTTYVSTSRIVWTSQFRLISTAQTGCSAEWWQNRSCLVSHKMESAPQMSSFALRLIDSLWYRGWGLTCGKCCTYPEHEHTRGLPSNPLVV